MVPDHAGRAVDEVNPQSQRATLSAPASNPQVWDAKQLRRALVAAGVALWSWNVDTDELIMDELGYQGPARELTRKRRL